MSLNFRYARTFERDVARMKKRGKNLSKLEKVTNLIVSQQSLPPNLRDHKLIGDYVGTRECHIDPDWLLVYRIDLQEGSVIFERTGTHSDLFR